MPPPTPSSVHSSKGAPLPDSAIAVTLETEHPHRKSGAAAPKLVGWTVAVAAQFEGQLPHGYSRNTLAQEKKPRVEAAHGSAIPKFLLLGSPEARAVANTIRRMYAEEHPHEAVTGVTSSIAAARAALGESERARFDRLLTKARDEQSVELRVRFLQAVRAEVDQRLPAEAQREIERAHRMIKAATDLEHVWRYRSQQCVSALQLFLDNWRTLIGCLHPDRADQVSGEEVRARRSKASDIVTRTKDLIEQTDFKNW